MTEYTEHQLYPKPQFDDAPFIDAINLFADMVDEDIHALVAVGGLIVEAWDNSTAYVIGDRVLDTVTDRMFRVLVSHTSESAGTFAASRLTNPTYWEAFGSIFNPTGAWAQSTAYLVLDHAYQISEGVSAVCIVAHTSTATGTIRTDASNWAIIVDLQASLSANANGQLVLQNQVFGD